MADVPRDPVTAQGPPAVVVPPGRRVVVLVSGSGTNLAALLAAHDDPAYGARVVGVVSNKAGAHGLERARAAGVATAVVAPEDFPDRLAWDRALTRTVEAFDPDLVVLAGFMRLLGEPFLARFGGRVLNTHPALLPSFPGIGSVAVRQALEHGVKLAGSTLHLVDEGTDTGPIVAQVAVPVLPDDTPDTLFERIKEAERAQLVEWVGRIVREGMTVEGRRVRVGPPAGAARAGEAGAGEVSAG